MIDTVKFRRSLIVLAPFAQFADSEVWKSEHKLQDRLDHDGEPIQIPRWHLRHEPTGMRASGSDRMLDTFEVSLPRVLYGHNGRLLKSQYEINAALERVYEILGEVGDWLDELPKFSRVDLVWQFRGDPKLFIAAHKHARHKRIRRDVVTYENGSLTWKGSNQSICLYDKTLEMCRQPGDIVRMEVRLRKPLLNKVSVQNPLTRLDFARCYEVYRNTLLGFCPSVLPKASNIAQFLAVAERENWRSNGVSAFDIYTKSLCARQIKRLQRQIAQVRFETFHFDWTLLLPPQHAPEAVEVTEALIQELAPKRRIVL